MPQAPGADATAAGSTRALLPRSIDPKHHDLPGISRAGRGTSGQTSGQSARVLVADDLLHVDVVGDDGIRLDLVRVDHRRGDERGLEVFLTPPDVYLLRLVDVALHLARLDLFGVDRLSAHLVGLDGVGEHRLRHRIWCNDHGGPRDRRRRLHDYWRWCGLYDHRWRRRLHHDRRCPLHDDLASPRAAREDGERDAAGQYRSKYAFVHRCASYG